MEDDKGIRTADCFMLGIDVNVALRDEGPLVLFSSLDCTPATVERLFGRFKEDDEVTVPLVE